MWSFLFLVSIGATTLLLVGIAVNEVWHLTCLRSLRSGTGLERPCVDASPNQDSAQGHSGEPRKSLQPLQEAARATPRWDQAPKTQREVARQGLRSVHSHRVDASSQEAIASVGAIKKLSFDDLRNREITSVSRPEGLSETASTMVIARDDICRSGAIRLSKSLRLGFNLWVDEPDASQPSRRIRKSATKERVCALG
jgi:hypothetical protein